jgi:hypothetical protein
LQLRLWREACGILTHSQRNHILRNFREMKITQFAFVSLLATHVVHAGMISAVPGPDDQGGMIMPMVTIQATSGTGANPSAGNINVNFTPSTTPVLRPLTEWSPGNWFDASASWAPDISPTVGSVFGMPVGNAGDGDLFNNRYGFMFMSMGSMMMANVPSGKSLAIRLDSATSVDLKSFNYGNADNRWDQVFDGANSQVLWNGTMWHNYFTMPAPTAPGTYTAIFEVFIANTPFTGTTGFAQYDATALAATKDSNFNSAFVTYDFSVIPEPSALALGMLALLGSLAGGRSRKIV